MCQLCNGTGGVTLQHSWGAEFLPCKHPDCDFDRDEAIKETEAVMAKLTTEIMASNYEVS